MRADDVNDHELERLVLLCELASRDGLSFSVQELIQYLPASVSAEMLGQRLNSYRSFSSRFVIRRGLIIPYSGLTQEERIKKALLNLRVAKEFSNFCPSGSVLVLGVSGSNSYLSASEKDDIDIFCIAQRGRMWLYLTKALIFTRLLRYMRKGYPEITVSCIMDEEFAVSDFSRPKDLLYARDAVTVRILSGKRYYASLLKRAEWIEKLVPREFWEKVEGLEEYDCNKEQMSRRISILNSFLFILIGNYIRLKSTLLNRKLSKEGRRSAVFRLKMGTDHLIYESSYYLALKRLHSNSSIRR